MKRIIIFIRASIRRNRNLRAAVPIAAAIIGARTLSQEAGHATDVDYHEIADEAFNLVEALRNRAEV